MLIDMEDSNNEAPIDISQYNGTILGEIVHNLKDRFYRDPVGNHYRFQEVRLIDDEYCLVFDYMGIGQAFIKLKGLAELVDCTEEMIAMGEHHLETMFQPPKISFDSR